MVMTVYKTKYHPALNIVNQFNLINKLDKVEEFIKDKM